MSRALIGKRGLIYGGGTGLGFACAEAMLSSGAAVFITGRRRKKLEEAKTRLGSPSSLGLAAGDFTREGDVANVTEAALRFLDGLDTLVVSSGTSGIGSTLTETREQFDDILTTNLVGPFLAVRAAAPHLIRGAPASVILLASVVGVVPMKERLAYSTSKAGIIGMARAMALDLAEHRVRVNAISPSLVLTELAHEILSREADPAASIARREAQHPLGRLGQPRDISSAAVYLAGEGSAWMTGQNLVVDGGLSIS
jgi:NAD(P)-dependent dehydrogenase (short-subunit alcohol dehydrogenase family)